MAEKKNGDASAPPHAPEGKASAPKAKMTKMEAVTRALHTLGMDTPRGDLQKHILKEFGIEMTADHISNYKGEIKRKLAKSRKKAGKPKVSKAPTPTPPVAAAKPVAAAAPAVVKANSVSLEAVQAAKGLLGLLAPDQAKALIDVLAR
jgi:hypothetical protein